MHELTTALLSINPFKDLLVPALAALAGLWLATRKFRKERIWQEKYEAYQRVLTALEAMRFWAEEVSAATYALPSIGWFDGKTAGQFFAEAKREISKQCSIGTLLLPHNVVKELEELQSQVFDAEYKLSEDCSDDQGSIVKHAYKIRDLVDSHLATIVKLARADLGA